MIGSAALYYRLLTGSFFFFGEGERGQEREIGKDDKSKDGESFGNKGIASCSVFISNRFIERRFVVNL